MECFIEENCKRKINKACKKNPPLKGILESRRVHILKSFVLTYKLDDGIVYFIDFGY